jgi:AraC-like DNA-binding protein
MKVGIGDMSFIPMIHSGLLAPFLARAAREGDWFHEELWSAGLPPSLAEGAVHIIPFRSAIQFVSRTANRLAAPDFGLQVGADMSIRALPGMTDALRNAVTLLDAINAVIAAVPKMTTVRRVWLEPNSGMARLCHVAPNISLPGAEHAEQFALMLLINLVREVAGRTWSPCDITVRHSTLQVIGPKHKLLGCSTVTAGPYTSFTFDPILLKRRLPCGSPDTDTEHGDVSPLHQWTEVPQSFVGSVVATLESSLRTGRVGLESITHSLGISARTLQRELAAANLTYEQLLAEARLRLAQERLAHPEVSIADIAFELGYQDAANFTRAFRRWTGMAPVEYRKLILQQSQPPFDPKQIAPTPTR